MQEFYNYYSRATHATFPLKIFFAVWTHTSDVDLSDGPAPLLNGNSFTLIFLA